MNLLWGQSAEAQCLNLACADPHFSMVSLCLLGIIGLSATPILRSKENYWTAFDSNGQQPAFSFG